jgi:hypothetical protein
MNFLILEFFWWFFDDFFNLKLCSKFSFTFQLCAKFFSSQLLKLCSKFWFAFQLCSKFFKSDTKTMFKVLIRFSVMFKVFQVSY